MQTGRPPSKGCLRDRSAASLARCEATDFALEGASQLVCGAAHCELDVVRKLGHDGRLTMLDAGFHDALGVAGGLFDPVLVADVHLHARDATGEVRESVLRPIGHELLES